MESNVLTDCCRLCFSVKNEYVNINGNSASGLNVAQTINKYIQVKVVDEDLLPRIVCLNCWKMIESFDYFHEMVITAQTDFLTKSLKKEIKQEDDGRADAEEFVIENVFVESLMELDHTKPIITESFSQSDQSQQNRNVNKKSIGAFICDICEMTFDSKMLIEQHIVGTHVKSMRSSYKLEHLDSKHANGDYTCDICEKHYRTKTGLKVHRLKKHDIVDVVEKTLKTREKITIPDYFDMSCDKCSTMLNSLKHAQSHYIEEHQAANGYVKCCKLKMASTHQINEHIKWHQDPNIFRCDLCEISFVSRSRLTRHNARHINVSECDICKKKFTSKYSLIFHKKTIHEPKQEKFKCLECGKTFSAEDLLKIHLRTSHIKEKKEKSEICEYCAERFSKEVLLKNHIQKMHSDDRPKPKEKLQCNVCGGWYRVRYLQRHLIMHNGGAVKCDLCDRTLANQNSLYHHNQRFHKNGGTNFKCHLCQKEFRNKSDLEDHIGGHTNEKKHKCSYCDKTYIWRAEMYKHKKKKHFEQWSTDKDNKTRIS